MYHSQVNLIFLYIQQVLEDTFSYRLKQNVQYFIK